ncbi:MAG TPA: hypothetical protein VLF66_18325 [Thermoanaerobaculia bacterium]|nr:hypothetical protein [Thermoanaerobaculia bacterium]
MKRLLLPLAVLLAASAPAAADDVYLANGQVFEGVVARRDGDKVRIRLQHGEMGVPASWVVRIEASETPLAEYLRRKEALAPGTPADGWLELARWARGQGLPEGAREAALRAADLDPRLEGLAPILQPVGFVLDEERGVWVTEAQLMASRGYVRTGGTWVSAEALAERRRQDEEERAAAKRRARDERLDQVITLLALAQLRAAEEDRERAQAPVYTPYGAPLLGAPVAVFPGTFHPGRVHRPPQRHRPPDPGHGRPPAHPPKTNHGSFSYDALAGRQPGSIIPLAQDPGAERGKR